MADTAGPPRRRAVGLAFLGAIGAVAFAPGATPAAACDSATCVFLTRNQIGAVARGSWRLDVSGRFTDEGRALLGSRQVAQAVRPRVDFESRRLLPGYHTETGGYESFLQLDVAYGLSSRLAAVASLPLIAHRSYTHLHVAAGQAGVPGDPAHDHGSGDYSVSSSIPYTTGGIGDALLGVAYAARSAPRDRWSVGFASKLPTGHSRLRSDFDGGIQDPTLQPGTGAFAFVASTQYARLVAPARLTVSLSGSYQMSTTSGLGYRFGNETLFAFTLSRPLAKRLTTSLQAKWHHTDRHLYLGRPVPSSGASFAHLTPGLRFDTPEGVSFYGFAQLPIYRYVNESQLAPRSAFLMGFAKSF